MAQIFPFRAILYRPVSGNDIGTLVAPPYDVIDAAQRQIYHDRSDHNIVRLVLPEGDSDGKYESAARQFDQWLDAGVLSEDGQESFYVWEQQFEHDGRTYHRRALVAKVACGPYQAGGVMRHELTHAGPKADRLKLFQATGAQFSQLFGIFDDPGQEAQRLILAACDSEPLRVAVADDGHVSRLYRMGDTSSTDRLQQILADRTVVMADGHHRYETAVAYFAGQGQAGAALMTLVPSDDAGLLVKPTHRVTPLPLGPDEMSGALDEAFIVERHSLASWPGLHAEQLDTGGDALLVVSPHHGAALHMTTANGRDNTADINSADIFGAVGRLHHDCLPLLAARAPEVDLDQFDYHHDAAQAVQSAGEVGGWAFLLPPTLAPQLLKVAREEAVLPPKSTYFHPKFLSGFVSSRLTAL